jgi:Fe(3+) dicitrate transport protein
VSNKGISGVHVLLMGTETGTVTDQSGYFEITDLNDGNYTILFRSMGYEAIEVKASMNNGQSSSLEIFLNESIVMLRGATVESFSITGGTNKVNDLPGSAHYITPKQLEKFSYNDINRILRNVPGVNIQDEEGFGLRPNIGLRGTGSERSSKITLMEDGILIAPAPYVAPSAYYFPTAGRMQGVEVRKGSSQIKYGPYTTGGALNLISTTIPDNFFGRIHMFGGSYGKKGLHAFAGNSYDKVGFLIETYQDGSNGFKELENGNTTGYRTEDYLVKLRVNSSSAASLHQSLTVKAGRYFQDADETYLGLTDNDFTLNPVGRYSASQLDNIQTDQSQLMLSHYIEPFEFMKVSTSLYRTDFSRNWYKLDKVKASDSTGFVSISNILEDPFTYDQEFQIINGATSPNEDALRLKANNRSYWAQGVQTLMQSEFKRAHVAHYIDLGFRYHVDQIDRFQWLDEYRMDDGVMKLTNLGIHGTESNRIETAHAIAGFVQYTLKNKKWTLVPGLRIENILIDREDYGKNDPERTGVDLKERENQVNVIIPGIGIDYKLSNAVDAFIGIHKGFSPPGSKEGTLPESSINYELGARANSNVITFETVLYYNDYDNLLGVDLAASGGTGSGDLFNGGEAVVFGSEISFGSIPVLSDQFTLPIRLSHTYTYGEFRNSFQSEYEAWGDVEAGDELPYIAPHQFVMNVGLEHKKFNVNLSSKYTSSMRTEAGAGDLMTLKSTDQSFIIDLSGQYNVTWKLGLFASVYNLSNATYIVSRRPAGVRPGLPRSFILGVKSNF